MTLLNARTLGEIDPDVQRPRYDRAAVRPGILHLGVGGFHRAHQAMYIDRLLATGDSQWGISGVGTLPTDRAMRDALTAQDMMYTLLTTAPDGSSSARIIGSIVEYLYAPDEAEAVLDRLADPSVRIVSLTITEGGYGINDAAGEFDPQDEATVADLVRLPVGAVPRSALGFLLAGLRARRDAGQVPFTVLSCDNIQGNGAHARKALLAFAERVDPPLARWIAQEVRFPNSMVDRITPVTTAEMRRQITREFGIEDRWPVVSEAFEQWVLEDTFPAGRPDFAGAGVQLVDDVEPYELMKLRLLNASHQVMSYLGLLAGATFVHEVCRDPLSAEFLLGYMHEEAKPTLRPVPGVDLDEYCAELMRRFSSEAIKDTLARQIVDASDRIPKFLLPVVRDRLSAGENVSRAILVLAAWSRFIEDAGSAHHGSGLVDKRSADLNAAAAAEESTPGAFLDYEPVFGDLGGNGPLREQFVAARRSLNELGARGAMAAAMNSGGSTR